MRKRSENVTFGRAAGQFEGKGGVVVFFDGKSVSEEDRSGNSEAVELAVHSTGRAARALDVFIGVLGLTFFAPILLLIAIAIKLNSRGPVFVREVQRGSNGQKIQVLRFRLVATPPQNDRSNPRLTWIGTVLAGSGIDKLPQLVNVLRGELSLAGAGRVAYGQDNSTKRRSKESANRVVALLKNLFSGESFRERR